MSINNALSNAYSGLSATGRLAEVAANNIANALNDDYNRKEVQLSAAITDGRGAGVEVSGIRRAVNNNLVRDLRLAEGELAYAAVKEGVAGEIATAIGGPEDPASLFALYQDFETALETAADTPENQAAQRNVVQTAGAITTKFNDLSAQAALLRTDADAQIARDVQRLNSHLSEIESLNREIELATVSGRDTSALLDQRQKLLDEVSQIIPIKEVQSDNGKVNILTESGVFLLDRKAKEVQFTAAGQITQGETYAGGQLSGLFVGDSEITPGSGFLGVSGGSIGALFEVRDEIGVAFAEEIDGLARGLIERFQSPTADATLAVGDAGLFTDAGVAFDPLNEEGLASRLSVNAAVDPDQGGEARRVRDGINSVAAGPAGSDSILRTQLQAFRDPATAPTSTGIFGDFTALDTISSYTSVKATESLDAGNQSVAVGARVQSLFEAERTFSGVDTDFETAQLILIEQAYGANAKVIEVIDSLIQRLLEI